MGEINRHQASFTQNGQVILCHEAQAVHVFRQLDDNRNIKLLLVPYKCRHQVLDAGIYDIHQRNLNQPSLQHFIKRLGNKHTCGVADKRNEPKDDKDPQSRYRQRNQAVQKLDNKNQDVKSNGQWGNEEQAAKKIVDYIFISKRHSTGSLGSSGCYKTKKALSLRDKAFYSIVGNR